MCYVAYLQLLNLWFHSSVKTKHDSFMHIIMHVQLNNNHFGHRCNNKNTNMYHFALAMYVCTHTYSNVLVNHYHGSGLYVYWGNSQGCYVSDQTGKM